MENKQLGRIDREDLFKDVADELEVQRTSFAAGENRPTGARARFKLTPSDAVRTSSLPGVEDDRLIDQVINEYVSLSPSDYIESLGKTTLLPFFFVGQDQISEIDKRAAQDFFDSPEFKKGLEEYPVFSPRKIKVSSMNIVYLGQRKAAAAFHVEEEHKNGAISSGNCAAILVKEFEGWRIAVYAQHEVYPDKR